MPSIFFCFSSVDYILDSKRIKGLAHILFVGKQHLKQAKILSVGQVLEHHKLLRNEGVGDFDRAAIGYLLIALFGRCRHSDLVCVEDIIHDHS